MIEFPDRRIAAELESMGMSANDWLKSVETLAGRTDSFIVVIRSTVPKAEDDMVEWRGSAEHAQSGERIYFVEFSRLNEYIAAHCGITSPPSTWRIRLWQRRFKSGLSKLFRGFIGS